MSWIFFFKLTLIITTQSSSLLAHAYDNLIRHPGATTETSGASKVTTICETFDEKSFLEMFPKVRAVSFIHSCSLEGQNSQILIDILGILRSSGLIDRLDMIWVLNYGVDIADSVKVQFPKVAWVQCSRDVSGFEVPTIRALHKWSQLASEQDSNAHVLYLHTKGVSYREVYQQIEDWRRMMMYFLVEEHVACYHLLQSGLFDAIGSNYVTSPTRYFSGNFWWATTSYLSSLPDLSITSGKYDAEHWVLSAKSSRIYVMHSSAVNHAIEVYPGHKYIKGKNSALAHTSLKQRQNFNHDNRENVTKCSALHIR